MTESASQISSTPKVRNTLPHLLEDSIFKRLTLDIFEELSTIFNPVLEDKVLENLTLSLYKTEKIPRLFALCHINQMVAKAQIITALKLVYFYLKANLTNLR